MAATKKKKKVIPGKKKELTKESLLVVDKKKEATVVMETPKDDEQSAVSYKMTEPIDEVTIEAMEIFKQKKHPAFPVIHAFLSATQEHNLSFDTKATYLKYFREPEHKVIFYLFMSRKPQVEVKAKASELEAIKNLIMKETTNTFVGFSNCQEGTQVGSYLMEHFEVPNRSEGEVLEAKEEETSEKRKPIEKKTPEKKISFAIVLGQNILKGLKDGKLEIEDLEDEEIVAEYLEDVKVEIPDDFDLKAFLTKTREKFAEKVGR